MALVDMPNWHNYSMQIAVFLPRYSLSLFLMRRMLMWKRREGSWSQVWALIQGLYVPV